MPKNRLRQPVAIQVGTPVKIKPYLMIPSSPRRAHSARSPLFYPAVIDQIIDDTTVIVRLKPHSFVELWQVDQAIRIPDLHAATCCCYECHPAPGRRRGIWRCRPRRKRTTKR